MRTSSSSFQLPLNQTLLGFLQQHHVRLRVIPQYAQALSVCRPVERRDLLRRKVGNPAARRAIERMDPDIVYAVFVDGIRHTLAIRGELHTTPGDAWIRVDQAWCRRTDIQ